MATSFVAMSSVAGVNLWDNLGTSTAHGTQQIIGQEFPTPAINMACHWQVSERPSLHILEILWVLKAVGSHLTKGESQDPTEQRISGIIDRLLVGFRISPKAGR